MTETQPMMLQELCYTAADFRLQLNSLVCDEGVADVAGGSLLVTTGGSGLDLFVAEGGAFIASDSADQGIYSVYNDAQVTLTATTASGANPRVDTVIATVNDSQLSGTDDDWVLSVLAGTPNAAAALTDAGIAASATALPDRSIALAYVLVPTSFAGPFVNATHILDVRNSYGECGGAPWVSLSASAATSSGNNTFTQTTLATVTHRDRPFFSVTGSTITVLQTGLYDVNSMIGFSGITTAGTQRITAIYRNNTNLPNAAPDGTILASGRATHDTGEAADSIRWTPTRSMVQLTANDTIKLATFQNTGGAVNTEHSADFFAHLTVRKVG
jgi:hypothetical protein